MHSPHPQISPELPLPVMVPVPSKLAPSLLLHLGTGRGRVAAATAGCVIRASVSSLPTNTGLARGRIREWGWIWERELDPGLGKGLVA